MARYKMKPTVRKTAKSTTVRYNLTKPRGSARRKVASKKVPRRYVKKATSGTLRGRISLVRSERGKKLLRTEQQRKRRQADKKTVEYNKKMVALERKATKRRLAANRLSALGK